MDEKISIIVPIYKVEDYLEKCIKCLISQTYHNLEIILVDDGSPDSCGEICDKYAAIDKRIVVIHKENAGVAMARNSGLDIATGDYISFIDSDDWMAESAYEYFLKNLKKYRADCVVGRCQIVYDKDGKLTYTDIEKVDIEGKTAFGAMKKVLNDGSAVWNRLFKRSIFDNLRFPVGRINDDEVMALHAYAECKRIVFLNEVTYYYRIRKNSITTAAFSLKNVDFFYNARDNMAFVTECKPSLRKYAERKYAKAGLYCLYNLAKMRDCDPETKIHKKEIIKEIRESLKKDYQSIKKNKLIPLYYKLAISLL